MAGIYVQFLKGNKPSDYSKCDFFSATCFWLFLLYMYVFLTLYWDNFRLGEQSQREQTVTQLSQLPTMLTAQRNTTQGSQWENTPQRQLKWQTSLVFRQPFTNAWSRISLAPQVPLVVMCPQRPLVCGGSLGLPLFFMTLATSEDYQSDISWNVPQSGVW